MRIDAGFHGELPSLHDVIQPLNILPGGLLVLIEVDLEGPEFLDGRVKVALEGLLSLPDHCLLLLAVFPKVLVGVLHHTQRYLKPLQHLLNVLGVGRLVIEYEHRPL